MKIINIEQGSAEWLKWRKTIITATDCPSILGSNPWQTIYKCWQKKLNLIAEEKPNQAMLDGIKNEPIARTMFIEQTGINMIPACVESSELEFLGASLDGISDCRRYILEVKCSENLYRKALNWEIPEYYMHQMQHQLLVSGCEKCFYVCYHDNKICVIEVLPDEGFIALFMPPAQEFWRSVVFFESPPLTNRDYANMNDNLSWNDYAKQYIEVDALVKAYEDKKDYLRKKLIELCGGQSSQGYGLKVLNIMNRGRVDYNEIPEIKDIDLDKYRKPASQSWKILVDK